MEIVNFGGNVRFTPAQVYIPESEQDVLDILNRHRNGHIRVVASLHAWSNAFKDRKRKKREFRRLWQSKISAGAKNESMSYSRLIAALKKKNIALDRKILATLAEYHPEAFKKIVEAAK